MFATGSRTRIAYVPETVFNTTPATPTMVEVPKSSVTLGLSKALLNDPTISSDRLEYEDRHGNLSAGGNVVATLRHSQFDPWLEAAFGGTWTTNTLKNGTVGKSFTIEEGYLDTGKYKRFTGMRINTWALEVNPGSIVQQTFSFMGAGLTTSSTALAASPTAPIANKKGMSHIGGAITVGGTSAICTAASITVSNGMTEAWSIGTSTAQDIVWAESAVSGSITFYVEDDLTKFNNFLNETLVPITLQITDGTNSYTITIPAAKFNTADTPVSGTGVLFMTMAFKGYKDSATGCSIQMVRT